MKAGDKKFFNGMEVEIVFPSEKNTRVKLPDGTIEKVPTASLTDSLVDVPVHPERLSPIDEIKQIEDKRVFDTINKLAESAAAPEPEVAETKVEVRSKVITTETSVSARFGRRRILRAHSVVENPVAPSRKGAIRRASKFPR